MVELSSSLKQNLMSPGCIRFRFTDSDLFAIARKIRYDTFVIEQSVEDALELDGKDPEAFHYLVLMDTLFVATARYRETEKGIKIERFAVIKEYRSRHIGSYLIREMIQDLSQETKPVYLHAQESAVDFYLKHGFEKVGEAFEEAGIMHYNMYLKRRTRSGSH